MTAANVTPASIMTTPPDYRVLWHARSFISRGQAVARQEPVPPLLEEDAGRYLTLERRKQGLRPGLPESRAPVLPLLQTAFQAFRDEAGKRGGEQEKPSQTMQDGREARGNARRGQWTELRGGGAERTSPGLRIVHVRVWRKRTEA